MSNGTARAQRDAAAKGALLAALTVTFLLGVGTQALSAGGPTPRRGLLGAELQAEGQKARVVAVTPGGPSAKAGLAPGDLIFAFNGSGFHFSTDRELIEGLGWIRAGKPVRLSFLRSDAKRELVVMPRAATEKEQQTLDSWLAAQRSAEENQRRKRAESDFEAMVRRKPIDITFLRTASSVEKSSQTLLPLGLDLNNRILDTLTGALRVGDRMVIRYGWENSKNALKMDVISSPPYVDLGAVLAGARGATGNNP